jgi:DNA-binding LacI/PurR family transcriptional regulator
VTNKLPSIRTVASIAGVSTATVSNVLNARRSVAPELAERVRAAVAELGYIADLGASRLRSRKSAVAGVVVPDLANPFFGAFVAALEHASRKDGYDLLIVSAGDDPAQEAARLRTLLTWRPAGLIIVPRGNEVAGLDAALAARVPIVAADRFPTGQAMDVVAVDNRAAAGDVTRHLIAGGRRHILAAAADLSIGNVRERCEGIRLAAGSEAEIEIIEVGDTLAESRARLTERLTRGLPPDALFTLNNITTLGALGALAASGLRVPDDIALVGFDDEEWMRAVSPPLTAVHQPVELLGREAWDRLMARIGGDTEPPRQIRLACTLEIRESTAPARRPADTTAIGRWAQHPRKETH